MICKQFTRSMFSLKSCSIVFVTIILLAVIDSIANVSTDIASEEETNDDPHIVSTTPATLKTLFSLGEVMDLQTGFCEKLAEVGGNWYCQGFDGNKDVCFDKWLTPPFNNCVMYSFGVGGDVSFEHAMVDVWGCSIYLHDPFVNHTKDFFHPTKHLYRPLGIGLVGRTDKDGRTFITFKEALANNGHDEHTDIHYLKIDIEEAEYEFLPDLISSGALKNVWQLHMEIHSFKGGLTDEIWLDKMRDEYEVLKMLEDTGFRRVRTTINNLVKYDEVSKNMPICCSDILWVNEARRPSSASA